jgi:hypothetical protein
MNLSRWLCISTISIITNRPNVQDTLSLDYRFLSRGVASYCVMVPSVVDILRRRSLSPGIKYRFNTTSNAHAPSDDDYQMEVLYLINVLFHTLFMEAILVPIESWNMFPEKQRKIFQAFRTPDVGWDLIVNQK